MKNLDKLFQKPSVPIDRITFFIGKVSINCVLFFLVTMLVKDNSMSFPERYVYLKFHYFTISILEGAAFIFLAHRRLLDIYESKKALWLTYFFSFLLILNYLLHFFSDKVGTLFSSISGLAVLGFFLYLFFKKGREVKEKALK